MRVYKVDAKFSDLEDMEGIDFTDEQNIELGKVCRDVPGAIVAFVGEIELEEIPQVRPDCRAFKMAPIMEKFGKGHFIFVDEVGVLHSVLFV
ncbi:MAG: hypothetical protein ACRD2G_15415 [Terriglobia bacterium]